MMKKRYGNNAKKNRIDVLVAQIAVASQNFYGGYKKNHEDLREGNWCPRHHFNPRLVLTFWSRNFTFKF